MKKIKSAILKFEDGSMEIIKQGMIFQCDIVNEEQCGMRVRTINLKNGDRINYLMGITEFADDEIRKLIEIYGDSEE